MPSRNLASPVELSRLLRIVSIGLLVAASVLSADAQIFKAPQAFPTGANPVAEASADFNADGKPDLVVVNNSAGTVSVLLGNGDGTFQPPVNYAVGSGPAAVAVGDFNGDGKPDLAVANSGSNTVSILLGNGDGTFQAAVNYTVTNGPAFMAVGDFNGDGKLDVLVDGSLTPVNGSIQYVSVLLGNGDGTFQPAVNSQTGSYSTGAYDGYTQLLSSFVAVGDFNGDGKLDLVLSMYFTYFYCEVVYKGKCGGYEANVYSYFFVWLGNGDGTFGPGGSQSPHNFSGPFAVGDFNGDGKLDLAASNPTSIPNAVAVFLGNGDGTLQAPVMYGPAGDPHQMVAGDLNGHGKLDLVLTDFNSGGVGVLLGNGDGTFQTAVDYGAGSDLSALAMADFNGDGKPDVAVTNNVTGNGAGTVTVLLGNGDGTLSEAPEYQLGSSGNPLSVAAGDFNGDGNLDLAVADWNATTPGVSVLLGNGDGTYQPAVLYAAGNQPSSVAFGDFNGDGKLDLVAANDGGGVSVLLGNGDGTFQTPVSYATVDAGALPTVVVDDVNGDGKLDLVVTDGNGHADVLLGNGDGTFQAAVSYTVGVACGKGVLCVESPAIGDFNGDGKLDLAVPDSTAGNVNVLLGNGDGTFQPFVSYPAGGGSPTAVAVGDFNADNKLDLAVATYSGGTVSVLLGNGDGTFQAAVNFPSACCPTSLITGDFNGDGKLDVAAIGGGEVTLLLGNGNGTFQPQFYAVGDALSWDALPASGIAAGDFTGNHTLDLAVSGGVLTSGTPYITTTVSVLLNESGFFLSVTDAGSSGGGTVTSNPAGINCGSTCSISFAPGTAVTLTPAPAAGFGFAGWSGACSGMGACSVTMNAFESVTATFSPVFALSVLDAGNGGGTVTSNPAGVNCGSACSASFFAGTPVMLTATPNATSNFTGWSGACSGTGTCTVTMNAAASATATFTLQDFSLTPASTKLTVQPGGQGTDVMTIAGLNGPFGSAIQLTCAVTGPAPSPTCALSAASVTPGANSATSTMTITAPTTAAMLTPAGHRQFSESLYALWLPLMFGVTLVAGSKKQRRLYWMAGVFPLLLLLGLQLGCASGSSNSVVPQPTNYTVTVTAVSGTITHTTNVTVTVP